MPDFWAGDEDSWDVVRRAELQITEGQKQGRYMNAPSEDDLPSLYQRVGSTGVVGIKGSLINGSSGWMRLFGVVGYDDIRGAMATAVNDPEASTLMFEVSSGGGHVHGLAEFAADVTRASGAKPSLTYTPDTMASAAYWAGSAVNGPIVMASTAEIGSLGILQVTRNVSKALEKEGIVMTIHRAGDMKARVNPFEELTPEAQAHLQSQLADLHGMFKKHVGARRTSMTAEDLAAATDGRTFLGKRGVEAKLADSVGSFDMALKLLDKHSRKKDTSSNSKGASMNMTPAQQAKYTAALASGATVEAALLAAGVVATAEQVTEMTQAHADFKAESDRLAAEAATAAAAAAATAAAAAAAANQGTDATAEVRFTAQIDLLKSQLSTAQAAANVATQKLASLEATTQTLQANHEALLKIARGAVAKMLIPMGGSAASADAMDTAAVLAEHSRVEPLFMAKFPTSQQSKAGESDDAKSAAGVVPMEFMLRTQQSKTK